MGLSFKDLFEQVKAKLNLDALEQEADHLIELAHQHSHDLAVKLETERQRFFQTLQRQQRGLVDAIGAKRARERYRRAMDARIAEAGNKALWTAVQEAWKREDQLFDLVSLILGGLIQMI